MIRQSWKIQTVRTVSPTVSQTSVRMKNLRRRHWRRLRDASSATAAEVDMAATADAAAGGEQSTD